MALQRYAFGASGIDTPALASQPESGWWWGGTADNGRGFFIEWQGNRAFLAGYMYDTAGNATWYVSDTSVADARSFGGTWLQFANGQTLTGAFRAPSLVNGNVAPATIQFQGADTAILTLPCGTLPARGSGSRSCRPAARRHGRPEWPWGNAGHCGALPTAVAFCGSAPYATCRASAASVPRESR